MKSMFSDDMYTLYQMVRRCLKIFLKNKASVFFSLLAPLIVFLLYILFLGEVQVDSVTSYFPEDVTVSKDAVKAFVDGWMIAGVMSVACITVSFSANTVMVQDAELGKINDFYASPVKGRIVKLAYFLFNFIVTLIICSIVLAVCFIYLAASGEFMMTASETFAVIGILVFSALSSTLITVFFTGFMKTESTLSAFIGIISAAIGFFIGAFMPLSIFPKAVRYIAALLPGTHSAGLFRNFLMQGALDNLTAGMPPQASEELSNMFTMNIDLFGKEIGMDIMTVYLAVAILLFLALNLYVAAKKDRGPDIRSKLKLKKQP